MKTHITEVLRRKVGLEKLYPYIEQYDLTSDGKPCAGLYNKQTGEIYLNSALEDLSPKRLISTYLHEVGHLIAAQTAIDDAPDASSHNQYFAVLVAVMYRRANMLGSLKIYDFCDTEQGQRLYFMNAPLPSGEDLVNRFRYIIRCSAALAKSSLTIEQIAAKIFEEDALPHWLGNGPGRAKNEAKISWADLGFGVALGILIAFASILVGASVLLT